MFRFLRSTRTRTVIALFAMATSSLATDASAHGFGGRGGSGGGHFGGGQSFGGGGGFGGRGPIGNKPVGSGQHWPRGPVGGVSGRWPRGPVAGGPWPRGPDPWRHPRPWRPIGWHPRPLPGPIFPVGGPVALGGGYAGSVATTAPVAASTGGAVAPTAACTAPAGSFVSVVFVPTISVADMTSFLNAYKVTMADTPNVDGSYRIRLSDGSLPADRIAEIVTSMRGQTAIVSAVNG